MLLYLMKVILKIAAGFRWHGTAVVKNPLKILMSSSLCSLTTAETTKNRTSKGMLVQYLFKYFHTLTCYNTKIPSEDRRIITNEYYGKGCKLGHLIPSSLWKLPLRLATASRNNIVVDLMVEICCIGLIFYKPRPNFTTTCEISLS